MANARYYLLDRTLAEHGTVIGACRARHERGAPGHLLGVAIDIAGTQALVKVTEASGWAFPGAALRVYTAADHGEARAMLRTPEWRRAPARVIP